MEGFLALGFLIGMGHALEADHLAAVGALATGKKGANLDMAARGAAWGLGHTLTLFFICSAVILLGLSLTERLSAALEGAVGIMLVILAIDVVRRWRKQQLHVHAHEHDDGVRHIHVHSHANDNIPHANVNHDHLHRAGFPLKSLIVGLMHGAAGSAGLLALAVAATQSTFTALTYVLAFGVGSILGMAALSFIAAWPLKWIETGFVRLYSGLNFAIAAVVALIGVGLIAEAAPVVMGTL